MTIGQIVIWSLVAATLATTTFSFILVMAVAVMAKLSRAMWPVESDESGDCNP